jgi:hypothetical protein
MDQKAGRLDGGDGRGMVTLTGVGGGLARLPASF